MGGDEKEKKTWGFASWDVDKDEEEEDTIIYTRHEQSGRVNQYVDNNDGGHGHFSWKNEEDFENSSDEDSKTDYSRPESNHHENPTVEEVEERSGCYLTSACIHHYRKEFDDNCYELSILRWFRDNYVSKEEIEHYYKVAPQIVRSIKKEKFGDSMFKKIYYGIIVPCVKLIEEQQYYKAYDIYKRTILAFEKKYCSNDVEIELLKENSQREI